LFYLHFCNKEKPPADALGFSFHPGDSW